VRGVLPVDGGEEGREPVPVDLAVGVQEDDHHAPRLLGASRSGPNESFALLIPNQSKKFIRSDQSKEFTWSWSIDQ
jgi:hypothetical protein